jgi:uncharacterized membrane-anchored protein YjiN (DUF445 family)
LALAVLLGAGGLALAAFPFRATWWGGWILAIAEAGVVGGLADWFAVTALFRRPLGLPIPHTALIPANWELMAARVGTMVGDRVLTTEYVIHELDRVDVADVLGRFALSVKPDDIDSAVSAVVRWAADQLPPRSTDDVLEWVRQMLVARPLTPILADVLEVAQRHGLDQRAIESLGAILVSALDKPEVTAAVTDIVDDVVGSYRRQMGVYPGFLIGLAKMMGLIDRGRLVSALRTALRRVVDDPGDPVRQQIAMMLARLPARLRSEPALSARVEAAKAELLASPVVAKLFGDAAAGLRAMLAADLAASRSQLVAWITARLERTRLAVASDAEVRRALDRWLKAQAASVVERYQDRVAAFIERGVRALGPQGAVRLIEEHAGDDLQYIRVNGTVVGGLAGGGIYAVHLLLRLL